MILNESVNNYNIKDVVYINPKKFKYKNNQILAQHPFIIMTIKDGKYYGAMSSTKGYSNNKDSFDITQNDIIGNFKPGRLKVDNIA